jgi:hypothetical protein
MTAQGTASTASGSAAIGERDWFVNRQVAFCAIPFVFEPLRLRS